MRKRNGKVVRARDVDDPKETTSSRHNGAEVHVNSQGPACARSSQTKSNHMEAEAAQSPTASREVIHRERLVGEGKPASFSNVTLGVSTTLQGRPVLRSSYPGQIRLHGVRKNMKLGGRGQEDPGVREQKRL